MESVLRENLPSYDSLFYIPLKKFKREPQKDKARSTNKKFQEEIDIIIRNFFEKFKVDYSEYKNAEDAVEKIKATLLCH
ncbi:MAG: hypothetical protein QW244_01690 [Candidatus Pacearchaeota archaeon]